MSIFRKILLLSILALTPILAEAGKFSGGVGVGVGNIGWGSGGYYDAAAPMLLAPISEVVDLTGQETLVFRWSPFQGRLDRRRFYDFWIFEGREQLEKFRIYKKRVPADEYEVLLDARMFEDGKIYTWAVRQVTYGTKSDWSYSSFEVIRGPETAPSKGAA